MAVGFPSLLPPITPPPKPTSMRGTLGVRTRADQATQNNAIMAVSLGPSAGQPGSGLHKGTKTLSSSAKEDQS